MTTGSAALAKATPARRRLQPLVVGALGLVLLPFAMRAIGLTLDNAIVLVILCMVALSLNLLVGYTGLVSFGHSAWFGIGGYAAALAQLHWFKGSILLPLLFSVVFTALLALVVGFLILRRRGVYFSLLTLALCALVFAISFRWTALTGGEGGLGGIERHTLGPLDLNDHLTFYVFVAVIAFAVLAAMLRVVRSPFGHVVVAIREHEPRARSLGYPVERYKLMLFVLSAALSGLAGSMKALVFQLAALSDVHWHLSGDVVLMALLGGMHTVFGPAIGAALVVGLQYYLDAFGGWVTLVTGLIFMVCVLSFRSGIAGAVTALRTRPRNGP
jgi:ABC-type branched-subunit amino acid transport system permease subunit